MPEKLVWTEPRDTQLKRLRAQGDSWDAIAAALEISRNAASSAGVGSVRDCRRPITCPSRRILRACRCRRGTL
jgi:hypothetical protein